jgi:hypothetical protein
MIKIPKWQDLTPEERGGFYINYFTGLLSHDDVRLRILVNENVYDIPQIVNSCIEFSDLCHRIGEIGWTINGRTITIPAEGWETIAKSIATYYGEITGKQELLENVKSRIKPHGNRLGTIF